MVKSKNKKRRAKASFREKDNADSMAIEGNGDGTVAMAGQEREREGEGEEGGACGDGEENAPALSAGRLKKKQRWEQKLLKTKVDALRKQRQKLNKRVPEQNATRKEVLQQLKTLVAAQTESHRDERKKLELARAAAAVESLPSSHPGADGTPRDGTTVAGMSPGGQSGQHANQEGGNDIETMDCDMSVGVVIGGRLKKARAKNGGHHRSGVMKTKRKQVKNRISRKVARRKEKNRQLSTKEGS